ncbi:hypothetical protein [Butyrivibrio sp. AD3002]|uniref:hypothetical protein n=1 Tax=Butyrivibrio sp. AD3002 TaxID=1280670 RepID=UPI0003FA1B79|nr:hypothetical protein [Butyrivibrio sp. AD3002]
MNFCFVQYNRYTYPSGLEPELTEIAGHFDISEIKDVQDYSLHTEYSFASRKLSTELVKRFPAIKEAHNRYVPQLWKSEKWADEFAQFVIALTESHVAPKVIEIHPPFNDYCDMDGFIDRFNVFEAVIHNKYPNVQIVVENRAGSRYSGGKFLVSKAADIGALCEKIRQKDVKLGVVLDFPQLLTAEHINTDPFEKLKYHSALNPLLEYRNEIKGLHIWGKKQNDTGRMIAHVGNLNTYFPNPEDKRYFLDGIYALCRDDARRFFVPEVNSGQADFESVVMDVVNRCIDDCH